MFVVKSKPCAVIVLVRGASCVTIAVAEHDHERQFTRQKGSVGSGEVGEISLSGINQIRRTRLSSFSRTTHCHS